MPTYSIILPVRNGGELVKQCVNNILFQSYTDFNLLVLDNCSTDGTLEWLRSLTDNRIKIYPAERSLSIQENWGRITRIPKNEFITLIGHDDLLNKEYLQTMDQLIKEHPGASLYQAHFTYIDTEGKLIRHCKPMVAVEKADDFLQSFLLGQIDIMGTGFMMRSTDYDAVGGIPPYPNLLFADFELWINLTKISYKATSAEETFSFRLHQSTTAVSPDTRFQQAFERFILFLEKLKKENRIFDEIIRKNAATFLLAYCKGLSHRLLRTPKKVRGDLSVGTFIRKCREYAQRLGVNTEFHPERVFSIKLAMILDSSWLGRSLFLGFKKIFPRPVLK